jgi:hypothetical protein
MGGILLSLLFFTEAGRTLLSGRWSNVKSVEVDRGTYFRLKVKLTYKGEPQDFNIVVGCNVRNIRYKGGGRTYEAGLIPTLHGRAMSDGKAVVIRAPNACDGATTANGHVPEAFMPVIIVYDDAMALTFGTAYISDDAYESPLSLMTFDRAIVEKASRAEFDDFRQNGPPNVVTRSAYHSGRTPPKRLEEMGIQEGIGIARHCDTYARFALAPIAREVLKEYWPQDRPRYWAVPTKGIYLGQNGWAAPQEIKSQIDRLRSPEHPDGVVRRDDGEVYGPLHNNGEWQSQDFIVDSGIVRNITARSKIGPPEWGFRTRNPSLYPASSDNTIRRQLQSGRDFLDALESAPRRFKWVA